MKATSSIFDGLTVLSLEQATVVPYLTFRLAQDGARVIRLEHPVQCDPNRFVGDPFRPGEEKMCSYFLAFNSGKQAVTINLKEERGRELLRRMLVDLDVDVFTTNQLPRNYVTLGIDYETLREVKPDLIWLGVTGFGPDSNDAAYDPILQARGGLMDLTGEPDGAPQVVGIPLPDMGTSEHAYGQVMKALYHRALTGEGGRIDVAMIDSTVSWLAQPITMAKSFGHKMSRRGSTHEFFAPVNVFPAADGFVFLAVGNDAQWQRLTALPGFEELAEPAYEKNAGRIADSSRLNERIAALTQRIPTADLIATFVAATLAVGKVQDIDEVCLDPAVRDKFLRSVDPVTGFEITMAPPPVMTPWLLANERTMTFPPRHGEHNVVVYGEGLGLGADEVGALRSAGVI